jgi:hypothetical protein
MSRYNKISRSRSKERYIDENIERMKYEDTKREREEEIDRKIERIKEDERNKEKEWEKERQSFLQRENDLLWEIDRMKKQEEKYNQNNPQRNRYQQSNYIQRGFQRFNPRQNQIYNFKRNAQYIDNQRNRYPERRFYYDPNNKTKSELDKIISNLDKDNNNNDNEIPKFKNKIYLPQTRGVNLVGLIIGPKGIFQKLLEEKTGCKIYINGKNVKKKETFVNPYDNDKAHVLIIGYSEEKVRKASHLVEEIIFADENTRNKIIQEQLKAARQSGEKNEIIKSDDYLMTPYGPPGPNARFYKVPNDLVGLIIGANGETIKKVAIESNCKVQAGIAPIPNTQLRYIFIEGNEENYQKAVRMIEKIIGDNANRK